MEMETNMYYYNFMQISSPSQHFIGELLATQDLKMLSLSESTTFTSHVPGGFFPGS